VELTIDIPDEIMAEVETAIAKHDARNEGRLGMTAEALLKRELVGWAMNFILSEWGTDYQKEAETLTAATADRISKALDNKALQK